jgi:hypothetical protein
MGWEGELTQAPVALAQLEAVEKLPRLSVLSTRKGIPELENCRKLGATPVLKNLDAIISSVSLRVYQQLLRISVRAPNSSFGKIDNRACGLTFKAGFFATLFAGKVPIRRGEVRKRYPVGILWMGRRCDRVCFSLPCSCLPKVKNFLDLPIETPTAIEVPSRERN